jgi:hypothetical protein
VKTETMTIEKRDPEAIEAELEETTEAPTELTAEQDSMNARLKTEAMKVVENGKGTAGLTKMLQRAVALPLLVWAAQLRHAQLAEERVRVRLAQIEEKQCPLREKVERAEVERQHALYTSNGETRLEVEAKIEEARMPLFALGDERRELEPDEKRSLNHIRYLETNVPDAPGGGVIDHAPL